MPSQEDNDLNDQHNSEHPRHHAHKHDDRHHHHDGRGLRGWVRIIAQIFGHSHQHSDLASDNSFLDNQEGIRTIWLALGALTITSLLQIIIVAWSGSVALLGDTIHNIGDGLNSIPLLIAFYLARRMATRRYTYGFGKAEDVAGIFIILSIAASAGVVFYESIRKLIDPEPMSNLGLVAIAAVIGFLGNEAVAVLQIRTGRKIGSAALVADGLHARTDGLTSLSVLLAVGGTQLGFPIVDPIIGLLIGIAILFITKDAIVMMWYRLMDAIEPEYMDQAESTIIRQPGVEDLYHLRMRWMGHRLQADVYIAVEPNLTTLASHQIAEKVRHELFHELPTLSEVTVHVDPWLKQPETAHELTHHHEPGPYRLS
ncbi:MAG: cation diffusion facilitator family transporter [Anaerolineae bacterium]|nr:MAG: cation diffusion facilitator family transporter [Anaerolineae bacterium]